MKLRDCNKANLDEEVQGIMTIGQEIDLWKSRAEKAYDKGEQAGIAQGILETARRMYAKGLPEEVIKEVTNLSPEEYQN